MSDANSTVEYRDIKGFPGYRVGSDGSVQTGWRTRGVKVTRGVQSFLTTNYRNLRLNPSGKKGRYRKVSLRKAGKSYSLAVHVLVLTHFVGPCPEGMECRHLNGVASDNRRENLAWGTRLQNIRDKVAHGTELIGVKNHHAKVDDAFVVMVREEYARGGTSYMKLGNKYGLHAVTIGCMISRKTWKHVP